MDEVPIDQGAPAAAPPAAPPVQKKSPKKFMIAIVAIIVVVIVVAAVAVALEGNGHSNNGTSDLVTKTPSQMLLISSDFPSGWQSAPVGNDTPENVAGAAWEDYAGCAYNITASDSSSASVNITLITFDSVEKAKTYYSWGYDNVTGLYPSMVQNVTGHFDQCFEVQIGFGTWANVKLYYFQEKNVVGLIMFGTYLNYNMPQSWSDSMLAKLETNVA